MTTTGAAAAAAAAAAPPQPSVKFWGGSVIGLAATDLWSPCTSDDADSEGDGTIQARVVRKRKLPPSCLEPPSAPAPAAGQPRCCSCPGHHTSFVSACQLPTKHGQFMLRAYRHTGPKGSHEPVVMVAGDWAASGGHGVLVLGSRRCDCREQLEASLRHIQEHGGAVIYLAQEGRGIGLANKVAAYALQDGGLDTVDANRQLGFADDARSYECVPFLLEDMGIRSVRLMTNNPFKVQSLRALGVDVAGRVQVVVPANPDNARYMHSKVARMGHLIDGL